MMFFSRLISCIGLLIIFFVAFLIKGDLGLLVFLLAGIALTIICVYELREILKKAGYNSFYYIVEIFAMLIFVGLIFDKLYKINLNAVLLAGGIFATCCWIRILFSGNNKEILTKAITSAAILILITVPLNCLTIIYMAGYSDSYLGVNLAFLLIFVTKVGDIGAYSFGTLMSKSPLGNHKIIPSVSPKKSWEGTIGGAAVSIIAVYVVTRLFNCGMHYHWWITCLLGLLLFIGGFIGDLSESAMKRVTGVKDSGSIIPGIGGGLDLVDSLLINAPLFYLFLKLFNIIH